MRRVLYLITVIAILSGCATAPVDINIPAEPTQDDKTSSYLEQELGYAGYYYMVLNFILLRLTKVTHWYRLRRIIPTRIFYEAYTIVNIAYAK